MGTRPLRHFYDGALDIAIDPDLGDVVAPWRRHRRRFLEGLSGLSADQWNASTRCDAWTVRDIVLHLTTADSFWVFSLDAAVAGTPTRLLADFDPAVNPEEIIAPLRSIDDDEVLARFRASTDQVIATVDAMDETTWSNTGESPVGHVATRLVLAHALWDSWLHERDIFVPLGVEVPVEADELAVTTWYLLAFGAAQGGLIGEPDPVGPGLVEPIDVDLAFDDVPGWSVHLEVDRAVRATRGRPDAIAVGSAVDLVECYSGRGGATTPAVPLALADQLDRARQIL